MSTNTVGELATPALIAASSSLTDNLAQFPFNEWLPWINAAATPVALLVVAYSVRSAVKAKRTDVLVHSHERFDLLMSERGRLIKQLRQTQPGTPGRDEVVEDIKQWAGRFWSLQFDQFLWWRTGFVDSQIFAYWTNSRAGEFERLRAALDDVETEFLSITHGTAWNEASHHWHRQPKTDFVEFIAIVRICEPDRARRQFQPPWWRRYGVW